MAKIDLLDRDTATRADLFTSLTAAAWLDADLASALSSDKGATIEAFARENDFEVPLLVEIEAFELPGNPVGNLEVLGFTMPMTMSSALSDGCPNTAQQTCPPTTAPGCPDTAAGCGLVTYFSADCPTHYYCGSTLDPCA